MGDPIDPADPPVVLDPRFDNLGIWIEDGNVVWGRSIIYLNAPPVTPGTVWQPLPFIVGVQYLISILIVDIFPRFPPGAGVYVSCDELHSGNNVLFTVGGWHSKFITPLPGNKNEFGLWPNIASDSVVISHIHISIIANALAFDYNFVPGNETYSEHFPILGDLSVEKICDVPTSTNVKFKFEPS